MYMNGYELSIEKTRKSEKGARIRCMYDYKKTDKARKSRSENTTYRG